MNRDHLPSYAKDLRNQANSPFWHNGSDPISIFSFSSTTIPSSLSLTAQSLSHEPLLSVELSRIFLFEI